MNKTFSIDLFDGHLILEDHGLKVLVDTGSPVTMGRDNHFEFMGQQHQCLTSIFGRGISDISSLMGYDIDVLMGMDLLERFYIKTDYQGKEITFSTDEIPFESICSVPIMRENGAAYVDLTVDGQTERFALDTGAKISYIDNSFTHGETIVDTKEDFHPLTGNYSTPIFAKEATIGGQTIPVKFGNLPPEIAIILQIAGIYGAIGFDLFNAFTVLMDFKNNVLSLTK